MSNENIWVLVVEDEKLHQTRISADIDTKFRVSPEVAENLIEAMEWVAKILEKHNKMIIFLDGQFPQSKEIGINMSDPFVCADRFLKHFDSIMWDYINKKVFFIVNSWNSEFNQRVMHDIQFKRRLETSAYENNEILACPVKQKWDFWEAFELYNILIS